ncbi:MAG TPA: energy-coupling factor transporter transmembrane component T [Pseudogracilibacillus sp.]|nr:energy-coupling factor transporter transmembrane component T [Pseudogracilibacillus sp.]
MQSFATFHPIVLFFYYMIVMTMTVFIMHPFVLILSIIGSLFFYAFLTPYKTIVRDLGFYILVFFLISVTNPIFVHKGETILFYLNDNPVTVEAFIYGFMIATMLVAVIFWSKSYSSIMTSDKFIYLFGKMIPKLSLIISMALRFIPRFKHQILKVNQTQKTLGIYTSNSITDRIMSGIRTFNSVVMWSMENAISQADAMKARGYGLKGRTNFSLFRWYSRDTITLAIMFCMFILVLYFNSRGALSFNYYPTLTVIDVSRINFFHFFVVFILFTLPSFIELKENLQWKYLKSKI